jgi:hypothetical protein
MRLRGPVHPRKHVLCEIVNDSSFIAAHRLKKTGSEKGSFGTWGVEFRQIQTTCAHARGHDVSCKRTNVHTAVDRVTLWYTRG